MKDMTRKDFLKALGVMLVGLICLPLEKWLAFGKEPEQKGRKEAKHYKQTVDLAG